MTSSARRNGGLVVLGTLALLAGLALLGLLILSLLTLWWSFGLPSLDRAVDYRPRQHLQILAANGSEIAQFGSEHRVFVPIAAAPALLKQAVLAVKTQASTSTAASAGAAWRARLGPTSLAASAAAPAPSRKKSRARSF